MKRKEKILKISKIVLILLFCLFNIFIIFGLKWMLKNYGIISLDEIIFHLKVPLTGTSSEMIRDIIVNYLTPALIIFMILAVIIIYSHRRNANLNIKLFNKKYDIKLSKLVLIIFLILNIVTFSIQFKNINDKFNIINYVKLQISSSTFIKDNYVNPKTTNIKFNQKRNLVYIYLESMESSFIDKKNGGVQDTNFIPELTNLANKNINFSNSEKIGGATQVSGTGWTIAGMVAQTAGVPLKIPIQGNSYTGYSEFLPGAYTIGDILAKNGYNQTLVLGSDASFGGRRTYFETHGNYVIKDYLQAKEDKIIDEDYEVFWGMEDTRLFEYAKKELISLSKEDKPFNLTVLTVNTHFPGYKENGAPNKHNNDYLNALSYSSKQVNDFVNWIKKQSFYKDTTIVISGDHLFMGSNEMLSGGTNIYLDDVDRRVYNVFINSALKASNTKNRQFATFDMYPTTLASIGAVIEGDRLALGTNLFSSKKTLIEEYGEEFVDNELQMKSVFYNNEILY